jgi:flagellar hook-associated protein 3 FlgL
MKTADASMVNITNIQTTFKEKSVLAANSTNNGTDMQAIAKEMMAEIQEIVSLGNTMQGDRYVFGGQKDLTKPFELSTQKMSRGMTKTLDTNQQSFFAGRNGVGENGTMRQMLSLKGSDGETYYLNVKDGYIYTQDFVENGYKNRLSSDSSATVDPSIDAVGRVEMTNNKFQVSDYFKNTGEIINPNATLTATGDVSELTFKFNTVEQQIVSFTGDNKYISMVKKNGTTEPTADTVNATAKDLFGTDIFDDADSGNSPSGTAMLNEMLTVHAMVEAGNERWMDTDGVTISDEAHAQTVMAETKMGARTQLYDSTKLMLTTQNELITGDITDVSSTDVARLAVKLMQEQTIYNMSLSLGGRILPQSLADYL